MSAEIAGKVVVLSAHLDDAVLSIGAALARASRRGAEVWIVTVLAGDPGSRAPAGPWDAAAGFRTSGEAARARRKEDRRACAVIGATPVWLPFCDEQYPRGAGDEEVWRAIQAVARGADVVLVPGFPLAHPDHEWLARLVLGRAARDPEPQDSAARGVPAGSRIALYVEQPYAANRRREPRAPEPLAPVLGHGPTWEPAEAERRDRRAKARAFRTYRSQIPLLSRRPLLRWRLARHEAARGGETIAWIPPGGADSGRDLGGVLGGNVRSLAVSQVAERLAGLFALVTLARVFGRADFGRYAVAVALVSLLAVLTEFGTGPYLVREGARRPERLGEVLGQALALRVSLGTLSTAAAIPIGLALGYDRPTLTAVLLFSAASVL
ncbi:MAG: PIG-L family deacetylase, partial [Acidobacteria bacterium]|nr:PIG-L family deacetylase [Acidobacteriota bacterium]